MKSHKNLCAKYILLQKTAVCIAQYLVLLYFSKISVPSIVWDLIKFYAKYKIKIVKIKLDWTARVFWSAYGRRVDHLPPTKNEVLDGDSPCSLMHMAESHVFKYDCYSNHLLMFSFESYVPAYIIFWFWPALKISHFCNNFI